MYRSPRTNVESFIDNIDLHLQEKLNNNQSTETIIIGDLNIDINEKSALTVRYLNTLLSYGFYPTINKPTRVTSKSSTCIDHCFIRTNRPLTDIYAAVLEDYITDHYPLIVKIASIDTKLKKDEKEEAQKINMKKLTTLISKQKWIEIYNTKDANLGCETFINIIKKTISECKIKIKVKMKKKKKEWITAGIINSIKERDRLSKLVNKSSDQEMKNRYKNYRNLLNAIVKKARYSYFKKLVIHNQKNVKALWNTTNSFLNNKKKINTFPKKLKLENGEEIMDEKEITNKFNEYFVNIGKKLADKIGKNETCTNAQKIDKSMFLRPVNRNEILIYISQLKSCKSPGSDGITADILKYNVQNLIKPLQYLINLSFETGIFPKVLKESVVVPIYKSGDKSDVSNYRPIALTSTVAKKL